MIFTGSYHLSANYVPGVVVSTLQAFYCGSHTTLWGGGRGRLTPIYDAQKRQLHQVETFTSLPNS